MEPSVSKIKSMRPKGQKSTTGGLGMTRNIRRESCPAPVASTNTARKGCLVPPNSVRDRYISNKKKESVVEQSPTVLCPETRPSVITGLTTSPEIKKPLQSASSKGSGKSDYTLSHPPLQVLNTNSTMPVHRIDANSTSLEDLLGNSAVSGMNLRGLKWLRRNLIYCIESKEKELFSMKQMLQIIENMNNADAIVEKEKEAAPKNQDNRFLRTKLECPKSKSSPVRKWLRLP